MHNNIQYKSAAMRTEIVKHVFVIIPLITFSSLLVISCSRGNGKQLPRGASAARNLVPVEAVVIRPQLLVDKIYTTGTLLANEEVDLRSETSGRITGVFFDEGKPVTRGQVLVKINDNEITAQLKQKSFEEKQASDVEQRSRKLLDIKGISQEDYDKVLNSLQMIQAEKEALESQLEKTEIIAPFDGVIGLRYISEGGYVTPSAQIASLQDTDPMKVEFSVPEKYAGRLKTGTDVLVQVGESQQEHRGVIYAVESKIDLGTRTMKARARVGNSDRSLIPGSFTRVEITLDKYPSAIVVPSESIVPELAGEKIYLCKNGKASPIPVKTGIRTENGVQIIEGLSAGDTLIVSGLLQLADGKGVQIKALRAN